ncbi:MAG: hypothetical protein P1V18_00550, partial [Candidatus Gracilibacteria bacterium]|nr:hypothetical protein [Candidatus Gracilibacteria bacterium]
LKEAGFEASHLSQIVRNAGWEEKLRWAQKDDIKNLLQSGKTTASKLAKAFRKKDWKKIIQALLDA